MLNLISTLLQYLRICLFLKKYNKLMNIKTKKKQTQIQRRNQWLLVGGGRVQTIGCKTGSRMYCTTQGI